MEVSQSKDHPVASMAALEVAIPELGSVLEPHNVVLPEAAVGACVGAFDGAPVGALVSHWKLT